MEDLFGDDAEIDVMTARPDTEAAPEHKTADSSDGEDLFGDTGFIEDDLAGTQDQASDEEEILTKFSVANHLKPMGDTRTLYLAKLPSFLDISYLPYDPDTLFAEIQQSTEETVNNDEKITKKRSLVNTLRWKYQEKDDESYARVSNSRFVKWSDGSMSLQVGEELFDVPIKNITKEHNYLTLMHAEEGMLRGTQRFSHSMTFQPFGLSSKSHAELKADIARRAITSKGRTVKLHTELIDPAELQKQAIKADNEKQKARRRQANLTARAMNYSNNGRDRTQLTARYLDDSDEELGSGAQRYADDNDDGFIEDDEDEAAGARLQALKDASAADYRSRKSKKAKTDTDDDEVSEDESIIYEDGAGEDSEPEAVMTPKERSPVPGTQAEPPRAKKLKRRIADSDEEDD